MARQIWLAPILNDNRERLLDRASEVLAGGPAEALLYLVPSRPLLELAAGRLLDGDRVRGVWGSLPVHLFRGFARFVLATAVEAETGLPIAPRIAIDQDELPARRSLISQLMKRLAREGKLRAIGPLAHRDGCINTIAKLVGEIQRAAKTGAEFNAIVEARARDFYPALAQESADSSAITEHPIPLQIDFDREVGLIYSAYAAALDRFGLTEDDADQLRTLEVLRGEVGGKKASVPWLSDVRLLVVDGFFDFTPVQGEILKLLIPQVSEVVVNLNRDERNAEIFRPFVRTIEQLASIADFEILEGNEARPVAEGLSPLRGRLFNPTALGAQQSEPAFSPETPSPTPGRQGCLRSEDSPEDWAEEDSLCIRLLDCGDRETEIREIAKEIKRLVLLEGYRPREVAVVVRERASYEETIARVFKEERIPCALGHRIALTEVPAVRAASKLFEMLLELSREDASTVKMSELADLVKSGYFRLPEAELDLLLKRFNQEHEHLLHIAGFLRGPDETNVGSWDADELENVIAFVGGDLRSDRWLKRARQLTGLLLEPNLDKLLPVDLEDESEADDENAAASGEQSAVARRRIERAEPVDVPLPGSERKPRPSREVHPALIAWSALVLERAAKLIAGATREAKPFELRDAIMRLLDQLQFAAGVRASQQGFREPDAELPALTLDLRGLEGLRRALSAAARSIEMAEHIISKSDGAAAAALGTFLEETMRCVRAQSLVTSHADADGIKVLEVTDVRGLRFRAVFIAGLVEGGFPARASRDWIYPPEERERLKQYGLTLEDISPDTLLKEEHYFYQAACRATERLYLSRPLVLQDGSETVTSYYIEELSRAVAPRRIRREVVRMDFDGHTLFDSSRSSELAALLVRQEERHLHRAQREGNFATAMITRLMATARERGYSSESARRRIAMDRERASRSFGRFDGVIGNPSLVAKLAAHYGAAHAFSASELSLYGRCAFKFFAEKVLKLEPRGEAALDLTALDAGSLLHEALRRFFEGHRRERLTELDRADLRRELGEVADVVFDEHERLVPPINPRVWRIDREIRKLLLEQVLDYELAVQEQTRSKDVRPAYFELAFGMRGGAVDPRSTDQRLELRRGPHDASETVLVRGQIDRVDIASDGTVIAYDYKLSRGAGVDDMQAGRALQLHLYLAALEQLFAPGSEIAGGGYYTMKGGSSRRNQGLYRAVQQAYTAVGKRTSSTMSDDEWKRIRAEMEARVWEFIDGIRSGKFQVDPSDPESSCPHCDFSAVCRYEKYRVGRKQSIEDV